MAKNLLLLALFLLLVGCTRQVTSTPVLDDQRTVVFSTPLGRPNATPYPTRTPCPTCAPCPICPPTPTASPTPTMGQRAEPIPFGTIFGPVVDREKVALIGLTEVYRGEEAWARILKANRFNDPPPEGMEYLLIYAEVNYLSGPANETLHLDQWDLRLVSQNQVIQPTAVVEPEPAFDLDFFPGASGGGWMAWTVFEDDERPLLVIGMEYDGSGGIYFAATP